MEKRLFMKSTDSTILKVTPKFPCGVIRRVNEEIIEILREECNGHNDLPFRVELRVYPGKYIISKSADIVTIKLHVKKQVIKTVSWLFLPHDAVFDDATHSVSYSPSRKRLKIYGSFLIERMRGNQSVVRFLRPSEYEVAKKAFFRKLEQWKAWHTGV